MATMKFIGLLVVAAVVLGTVGCGSIKGRNEDTARKWAEDFGYTVLAVQCGTFDSNDNGYVSCTVRVEEKEDLIYVECSSVTRSLFERICREQRIGTK